MRDLAKVRVAIGQKCRASTGSSSSAQELTARRVSEAVSRGPCEQRGDRGQYNVRACKVRACEVNNESGCTQRRNASAGVCLHFG